MRRMPTGKQIEALEKIKVSGEGNIEIKIDERRSIKFDNSFSNASTVRFYDSALPSTGVIAVPMGGTDIILGYDNNSVMRIGKLGITITQPLSMGSYAFGKTEINGTEGTLEFKVAELNTGNPEARFEISRESYIFNSSSNDGTQLILKLTDADATFSFYDSTLQLINNACTLSSSGAFFTLEYYHGPSITLRSGTTRTDILTIQCDDERDTFAIKKGGYDSNENILGILDDSNQIFYEPIDQVNGYDFTTSPAGNADLECRKYGSTNPNLQICDSIVANLTLTASLGTDTSGQITLTQASGESVAGLEFTGVLLKEHTLVGACYLYGTSANTFVLYYQNAAGQDLPAGSYRANLTKLKAN